MSGIPGDHEHAVALAAREHARDDRRARAQRDLGQLGLQQQRLDPRRPAPSPTGWRVAADDQPEMDRGLYIAASGMLAEQIRQDQIANDLANASTPGYKADRTSQRSFGDLLLANSRDRRRPSARRARPSRSTRSSPTSPAARCARPASRSTSHQRRRLLRRADRAGRALHAQRPVRARHPGPARDRRRRSGAGRQRPADHRFADGAVDPRAIGVFNAHEPAKQGDRSSPAPPPAPPPAPSAPARSRAPAPTPRARWST